MVRENKVVLSLSSVSDRSEKEEDITPEGEGKGGVFITKVKTNLEENYLEEEVYDKVNDPFWLLKNGKKIEPSETVDKGFIDVARVEEGGTIGELALVDGKPRMCTTKCLTRVHLIKIIRSDYNKAIIEIERKRIIAMVNFIKNIPLFSKLTRTYLGKLSNHFKFLNVTKDNVLFKEGDIADRVFIIKNGEFIVTKKLI